MINYIWSGFIVVSVLYSFVTGGAKAVSDAVMNGAKSGVELSLVLLGVMCFWSGIMEIAKSSGIIDFVGRIISPVTKLLFKEAQKDKKAMEYIVANITANIFGMGNAATPLGISAMRELDRQNKQSKTASKDMCMFVVINTASIQLIPTNVFALRSEFNSKNPTEILSVVWLTSICAILVAIILSKVLGARNE